MSISTTAFKAIQGFLLMGIPFVLFFWISGTLPFEFTVLSILLLMGAIAFLKVEVLTFIMMQGVDSVHEHLKFQGASKGVLGKVELNEGLSTEETLDALNRIKKAMENSSDS